MAEPVVYGPNFSTYVRSVRLALEEKGAPYTLTEVGMMQGMHKQPEHLKRNPFGLVPAFEHVGLMLYETAAILRYVDRAFPGAALQPSEVKALARMDQVIGIVDSFTYPTLMSKVCWQRMVSPMLGGTPDEGIVAEAMPRAKICVSELERLCTGPFFCGEKPSLADLHAAPIFAYFTSTPEGGKLMEPHRKLAGWWDRMSARESMKKTQPKFG